jgi:ribosomal protein S18 acetylase RimI-like enzyme
VVTIATLPAGHRAVPAALDVLSVAFATDPVMQRATPAARDRQDVVRRLLDVQLPDHLPPSGALDVAVTEEGEVVAAALWAGPDATGGLREDLRRLPAYVRALGRSIVAAARIEAAARGVHPRFDHWYLYVIGALPAARGSGAGGALLAHGLDRVDRAGLPAYLEASTERSAGLYRRHGFVTLGPVPGDGGTAMWRPSVTEVG